MSLDPGGVKIICPLRCGEGKSATTDHKSKNICKSKNKLQGARTIVLKKLVIHSLFNQRLLFNQRQRD